MQNELEKTKYEKIFIEEPNDITVGEINEKLNLLYSVVDREYITYKEIRDTMKEVVPTFLLSQKWRIRRKLRWYKRGKKSISIINKFI